MKIVIGSDEAGFQYKEELKRLLSQLPGVESVVDIGTFGGESQMYPNIAVAAAELVRDGEADRGLLVCGTGIGMAIAAGKVEGVRASVAHDSYSVERLIKSNNAQVLTMGERVVGLELAKRLVSEWVTYTFDPDSASAEKVALIESYEEAS